MRAATSAPYQTAPTGKPVKLRGIVAPNRPVPTPDIIAEPSHRIRVLLASSSIFRLPLAPVASSQGIPSPVGEKRRVG